MGIVNKQDWLRERGFDPTQGFANGQSAPIHAVAEPPELEEPDQLAAARQTIDVLTAEIARQAALIVELQGALRTTLSRQAPPAPRRSRVVRRPRGSRAEAPPSVPASPPLKGS